MIIHLSAKYCPIVDGEIQTSIVGIGWEGVWRLQSFDLKSPSAIIQSEIDNEFPPFQPECYNSFVLVELTVGKLLQCSWLNSRSRYIIVKLYIIYIVFRRQNYLFDGRKYDWSISQTFGYVIQNERSVSYNNSLLIYSVLIYFCRTSSSQLFTNKYRSSIRKYTTSVYFSTTWKSAIYMGKKEVIILGEVKCFIKCMPGLCSGQWQISLHCRWRYRKFHSVWYVQVIIIMICCDSL